METIKDFFYLNGEVLYKVLYITTSILLALTGITFVVSSFNIMVDRGEELFIDKIYFFASISSFISCLFMYGFCYLVKIAKTYDNGEENIKEEKRRNHADVTFEYKGKEGTCVRDSKTGRYDGHIIGTSYSYSGENEIKAELAFQEAVDKLLEE